MNYTDHKTLWQAIKAELSECGVVAISGFGGAGKTELAKKLGRDIPGIQLVHVDDYLDWPALQQRSQDWDGVLFDDIKSVHIDTFRRGIKPVKYLIIEGIGLFTADRQQHFDYRIWVDTPIEQSNTHGQARDKDMQELWETVWVPNDLDFETKHQPQQYADATYSWHSD